MTPAPNHRGNDACVRAATFPTTHWSAVLEAGRPESGQAAEALADLCRAYWFPVYAHVRRSGHDIATAQDLTQEFFARLIARNGVADAVPEGGRFRSFLLVVLKRFLVNEWERSQAQKRGGGREVLSIDAVDAEERLRLEPADTMSADRVFERRWAMALLDGVMERLRLEQERDGVGDLFGYLKAFLFGDSDATPQREIATRFGLSESAIKARAHRLRVRYRELLREEVARTVASAVDIEDELRHLLNALRN